MRASGVVKREGRGADERGVSAVLGSLLMLAVMMTLVPGMILLRGAIADEMAAQREAAQRAAWCARNPSIGPPTCEAQGPLIGYECEEVGADAWLCTPQEEGPVPEPPKSPPDPPTPTPLPPVVDAPGRQR